MKKDAINHVLIVLIWQPNRRHLFSCLLLERALDADAASAATDSVYKYFFVLFAVWFLH